MKHTCYSGKSDEKANARRRCHPSLSHLHQRVVRARTCKTSTMKGSSGDSTTNPTPLFVSLPPSLLRSLPPIPPSLPPSISVSLSLSTYLSTYLPIYLYIDTHMHIYVYIYTYISLSLSPPPKRCPVWASCKNPRGRLSWDRLGVVKPL